MRVPLTIDVNEESQIIFDSSVRLGSAKVMSVIEQNGRFGQNKTFFRVVLHRHIVQFYLKVVHIVHRSSLAFIDQVIRLLLGGAGASANGTRVNKSNQADDR